MESFDKKNNQDWQFYHDIPPRDQLREELQGFLLKRPEFDGLIKIGKTFLRDEENFSNNFVVSSRYEIDDRYEMLKARNIFAECETEELALKLERAL
ncbi:hypothetical protein PVAND_008528 [Polypedilum vanderplanki]|uniref:Uncharacterized protein n=1 Tax=Polypedilum vanderplanki TaxID=319348 RepID=A0A9J6CAJ1_POLVA|nr:hypothetical protein PVAND_008528 [Polypedilum vanderplanki]